MTIRFRDNLGVTRALTDRLRYGLESASVLLLGDSTGDGPDEWFYPTMTWLGASFPTHTVTHYPWSSSLEGYDPSGQPTGGSFTIQTGSSGDAYVQFPGTSSHYLAGPATPNLSTGFDLRVKLLPPSWTNVTTAVIFSKNGGAGNRGWSFYLENNSGGLARLRLQLSQDGTAQVAGNSTAAVGFTDGVAGWVRATFVAATSTATFYTSDDGITWTQLGTTVTMTGITGLFATTWGWELGARLAGNEPFTGKIYYASARSSVGGTPIIILDLDTAIGSGAYIAGDNNTFLDSLNKTWTTAGANITYGGSPGLLVFNASTAGQAIAYSNDGTRGPKQKAIFPPDVAMISYGHNESTTLAYRSSYKTLADALIAAFPDVGVVAVTQNPKTSDHIMHHNYRMRQVVQLAQSQGYGLVDAFLAFTTSAADIDDLVGDGTHPTAAGYLLWTNTAKEIFQVPQTSSIVGFAYA